MTILTSIPFASFGAFSSVTPMSGEDVVLELSGVRSQFNKTSFGQRDLLTVSQVPKGPT